MRGAFLPLRLFLCKNKVTLNDKIDEVDKAEEPAPTQEQEEYEHYNAYRIFLGKSYAQSYKQFNYPTDEGKDKKNNFEKSALAVKPLIK